MQSRTASSSSQAPPQGDDVTRQPSDADGSPDSTGPVRVFLIEDSPSVRDRLIDFLVEPGEIEMVGFAETEADAIEQLKTRPIDVAIVDINLKQGTGFGVIDSIRAKRPEPPPTIVVLTNYAFPEFELACRQRGADYFFDKVTQFGAVKDLLRTIRPNH
jgi:two-component system, OmpR family, response regulator